MRMSPAPSDPGKPKEEDDISNVSVTNTLPATSDNSDADSAEETSEQPMDDMMGYQLLPQDLNQDQSFVENQWQSINDEDDDNSDDDNDNGGTEDIMGYEVRGSDADISDEAPTQAGSIVKAYDSLLPEHLQMKTTPEDMERRELWKSSDTTNRNSVSMDPDHADKIKSIMQTFTLPTANLPAWASVIPEEEWKARLIDKLSASKSVSS